MELTGSIVSLDRANRSGLIAIPETTVPILFLEGDLRFRLPRKPIGIPVRFDLLETPEGYVAVNIRKEKPPSSSAASWNVMGACLLGALALTIAATGVFVISALSFAVSWFLAANIGVLLLSLFLRVRSSFLGLSDPLAWTLGCLGGGPMFLILFPKFFGSYDVGGKRFLVVLMAVAQILFLSRIEPDLFSRKTLEEFRRNLPAARPRGGTP
jgi:hypothetical protein